MNKLIWLDNQMDKIANIGRLASSLLLLLMVLLINVEVLGRYFFSFSTLISDEYSAYFFVGCTFLGFIYSFRKGHFLRVNIFINRLPLRYFNFFHLMASILGFLLSAIITYEVANLTYVSYLYKSTSIQPSLTPLFLPQLIMPTGMAAMSILFLNEAIQTLVKIINSSNKYANHEGT